MPPPRRARKSRDPPSPKPILDRQQLVNALEDAGISLKSGQLDLFYQLLHRQHYPPLSKFVDNYYRIERGGDENNPPLDIPLKNPVSTRRQNIGKQLPKKLLDFLADPKNDFCTVSSSVESVRASADGTTTKLLVRLHDGHIVESVIMRYINDRGSRATLCVSSQVGCAMGCTFCATGTMGIRGNLSCGEILEQLVHAGRVLAKDPVSDSDHDQRLVRNVVFMGMGEPLNNYNNVVEACRALIDRKRWNLAHGRVTVSTVGVTPKMRNLTRDLPEVSLALSLHAPNQEMRSAIVPAAKNYPIQGLIDALDTHMMAGLTKKERSTGKDARAKASKRKRAMIEYVMLEGDTSSVECAHQLGKLCENRHLVVNLIPYNQTDVKDKLKCPNEAHMKEFLQIVSSYGAFCTIRRTMGADITGACGQLVVQQETSDPEQGNVRDIEDVPCGNSVGSAPNDKQNEALITRNDQGGNLSKNSNYSSSGDYQFECTVDKENGMEAWIQPLAIATSVAASCFLLSSIILLCQRRSK